MRGSKRKGRRTGTWELRIDAGLDVLTGRRLQRSETFEGTGREADQRLAGTDGREPKRPTPRYELHHC